MCYSSSRDALHVDCIKGRVIDFQIGKLNEPFENYCVLPNLQIATRVFYHKSVL